MKLITAIESIYNNQLIIVKDGRTKELKKLYTGIRKDIKIDDIYKNTEICPIHTIIENGEIYINLLIFE